MYIRHPKEDNPNNGFIAFSDLFDDIIPFYEVSKNKRLSKESHHSLLDGNTQLYLSASLIDLHEPPIKL
ncbi:hypothetical protein [Kiloniella majae]|uniref:hypothetical protein n=1 Tax=Kiloniella majae TaxID=1938558 RepID=UPI000A276F42|nr:hypothetical protein [Kiloniella majae]